MRKQSNVFLQLMIKLSQLSCWGLCLLVAACSDPDNVGAVKDYINMTKKSARKPIEPSPNYTPVRTYHYQSTNKRNPFLSSNLNATLRPKFNNSILDRHRRKETLEFFPLDALRMVGTVIQDNQLWALISAPDGSVSHVEVGNYLGQNYGRINSISEKEIKIIELIPEGNIWRQRNAMLNLIQDEKRESEAKRK